MSRTAPTDRTGRPGPGSIWVSSAASARSAANSSPASNYRVDKMAETGLYEDGKKGVRRPGDPDQRIKDMDRDGVDAEIIFGILGVASRVRDHEAANEMLRIYNDWLRDFCSHYPDRQIGLACLPYGDIDAAVRGGPSGRQAWPERAGALLLVGHGADVAPGLGAVVEGGQRCPIAAPLPHFPSNAGECPREPDRRSAPKGSVHQRRRVPDEPDKHHRRDHRRRRARALSRICASAWARAASAGCPTRSTAWISSTRIASAT